MIVLIIMVAVFLALILAGCIGAFIADITNPLRRNWKKQFNNK